MYDRNKLNGPKISYFWSIWASGFKSLANTQKIKMIKMIDSTPNAMNPGILLQITIRTRVNIKYLFSIS